MPRETPLSTIHLQNMLTLRQAGATILFLAPGFYHGAETVDDLVDFIAGRAIDLLGLENTLVKRWGSDGGTLPADEVRSMFDRIAPVYDVMNRVMTAGPRPALAPDRGRGGRPAGRPGAGRVLRHRRFRRRVLACGRRRHRARLLAAHARARAQASFPSATWVEGDMLALPFEAGSFDSATVGFGVRNVSDLAGGLRELRRVLGDGRAGRRFSRSRSLRRARAVLPRSGSTGSCR